MSKIFSIRHHEATRTIQKPILLSIHLNKNSTTKSNKKPRLVRTA